MDINDVLPDIKLRFNIDHPLLEDCYTHGYESALAETNPGDNPHNPGTEAHAQWLEGWWAGFYGEEPLFDFGEEEEEQEQDLMARPFLPAVVRAWLIFP